jgi:hypothetical protein
LLGLGACGGDDEGASGGTPAQSGDGGAQASVIERLFAGSAAGNRADPAAGKKGGKLTVLSAGDVDYMDPGKTYYTYAIGIIDAIHRGLYAYPPDKNEPVPDLAEGDRRSRRTARPSRSSSSPASPHHGPGALDPVHVGLPGRRRLAERARRAERLLHDLGLGLHVDPAMRRGAAVVATVLGALSP